MIDRDVRDRLLAEPEAILEDRDLMDALTQANERAMGTNVVDLRGIAMERLSARLARLEDTHRTVIAAAYENLAGTNMIHRAVLRLLEPHDFVAFLQAVADVAGILRVDAARLVLESAQPDAAPAPHPALTVRPSGYVAAYSDQSRGLPPRAVTLRQVDGSAEGAPYGERSGWIRSEALLRLDLGPGRHPAMLALGAEDPHHFRPTQGSDLLAFLGGVTQRLVLRWLDG
jgi:uncharacterized protein YigA (DUF484 family)